MSTVHERSRIAEYDEDAILVDRAVAGDEGAFQVLFHRYYNKVFAISRGVLLDAEEAADAVQEIFTLVFRNLGRFDRRSRFSTWLFRIAVNRSIQQARKSKHRRHDVPLMQAEDSAAEVEFDDAGEPEIEVTMFRLHPADRALLTLFYWDELTLHEIGESLGCSANAAKTRLFRVRERFRGQYEKVLGE